MSDKNIVKISKFLSLILRHQPEKVGLELDSEGWADVKELLTKADLDMATLEKVVAENNKKRFAFNDNKTKIRASQGHSIDINLNLQPQTPPDVLYHGTALRFVDSIYMYGIRKNNRNHVHLSADEETAIKVGRRHGVPVVFEIDCKRMVEDGCKFYLSANGVWLTDHVPSTYVKICKFTLDKSI